MSSCGFSILLLDFFCSSSGILLCVLRDASLPSSMISSAHLLILLYSFLDSPVHLLRFSSSLNSPVHLAGVSQSIPLY